MFCSLCFLVPPLLLLLLLFVSLLAPTIVSLWAANGGNAIAYDTGDTITITFSRSTNYAHYSPSALLSTDDVNSLFSFSQSLGSVYNGSWISASVFVITCINANGASPKIGSLTVKPIHAELRDAQSISPAINSTSPLLNGTFVNVTGLLHDSFVCLLCFAFLVASHLGFCAKNLVSCSLCLFDFSIVVSSHVFLSFTCFFLCFFPPLSQLLVSFLSLLKILEVQPFMASVIQS